MKSGQHMEKKEAKESLKSQRNAKSKDQKQSRLKLSSESNINQSLLNSILQSPMGLNNQSITPQNYLMGGSNHQTRANALTGIHSGPN